MQRLPLEINGLARSRAHPHRGRGFVHTKKEKNMARTDNLRKQHADILSLAREINGKLSSTLSEADAADVRPLLSKLAGVVSLHLAMEDKTLYPNLAAHPDTSSRATAQRYHDEMGSIGVVFNTYISTWRTTAQMLEDPARFNIESKAIFNALSKRIHLENTELYPLLDKMAG
jgi:hemerythrin-like domain-containing protein